MRSKLGLAVLALAAATAGAARAADNPNELCAGCHDKGQKMAGLAHAGVACIQCHLKHDDYPHPAKKVAKPTCASCHVSAGADYTSGAHGQAAAHGNQAAPDCSSCHGAAHEVQTPHGSAFRKAIPETCGMCHSDIAEKYKTSVHGLAVEKGEMNSAVCTDCHGEHLILDKKNAQSPVNVRNQRETCGQCHGNVRLARRFGLPEDRITTFDASFHGLAAKGGEQTLAGCASCHGIHDILPSTDAKSAVNAKNLPQTCGKCHPGAGTRFILGPIHVTEETAKETPINGWVRRFYLLVIPLTIGLMLLHNGGDWLRKLSSFSRDNRGARLFATPGEVRMLRFERICHALLASSFIVLGWTGFALKFPDHWWAMPLLYGEPEMHLRRNIHRAAAVAMIITSVMHFVALFMNRELRHHWTELIPKLRDIPDAVRTMMYNMGLRSEKPELPAHSYAEKVEYWAVVWGTIIMVITGLLLWNNSWALKMMPKWVLDVSTTAHWYEAVLASLAIVVWHFYSVIFDPEVYPMDTAWLTGRSPRKREHESESDAEAEPGAR
jgi:cytochrome b subunit of formate dehydrogenase